jgi:hypothetical protein
MPRFAFDFGSPLATPLRLIGVGPGTASVSVEEAYLDVRFGLLRLRTPVSNLKEVSVTGPYNPLTAIGVRISLSDRGLTFGTTTAGGVCMTFRRPISGVLPIPWLSHPGLTVTVQDPGALRSALLEAQYPVSPVSPVRDAPAKKVAARKAVPRKAPAERSTGTRTRRSAQAPANAG